MRKIIHVARLSKGKRTGRNEAAASRSNGLFVLPSREHLRACADRAETTYETAENRHAGRADDAKTTKLLGLFTLGNMGGALDRKILKGGTVGKFPQQPDLTEQVSAALKVLARNEAGFFLMVESGMIDKYTPSWTWSARSTTPSCS